jgi:GT2 family glycosyltransferase
MPEPSPGLTVSVVVLSQGNRPAELRRCLDSMRAQRGVTTAEILCVGNGWMPVELGDGVRGHGLVENVGIPEGRNVGAALTSGELIFFLDDDAWIEDPEVLSKAVAMFSRASRLGAMVCRLCDDTGVTLRRWVPRAHVGAPAKSGPAFSLAEGVSIVRRAAFVAAGGWPGRFFYGHEGVEMAWRMRDAGWDVRYAADLVMRHPSTSASRHASFYRFNARNRVWVARRNLPVLLIPVYLSTWSLVTAARLARQPAALRVWVRGFVEGWRCDPGDRRRMRWRTVLTLTRLGQPPVI